MEKDHEKIKKQEIQEIRNTTRVWEYIFKSN